MKKCNKNFFCSVKNGCNPKPDIAYKKNYTIKNNIKYIFSRILLSLSVICAYMLLLFLFDISNLFLFVFFIILFSFFVFFLFEALTFKCNVSPIEIKITRFIFLKKKLNWDDIQCVKCVTVEDCQHTMIDLYDKNEKCVLSCSTVMNNVWYLIKTAEANNIVVKEETVHK